MTLMFLLGISQYSIKSIWSSPMYCWALSVALAKQMTLFQKLVQLPLDLAKYRIPQMQYGEFICPTVFSFCRYKDSTWGNAYWLRVMILPCMEFSLHVFWEKSAGSLSRRRGKYKNQGFMAVLFKVHWIRSPTQCQLLHLNVFTLDLPRLRRVSKTLEVKVWSSQSAVTTISSETLINVLTVS